jgi:hypothetical protein
VTVPAQSIIDILEAQYAGYISSAASFEGQSISLQAAADNATAQMAAAYAAASELRASLDEMYATLGYELPEPEPEPEPESEGE